MQFAVIQLGARRHYAVARALAAAGALERLFTDICASSGWPRLLAAIPHGLRPAAVRRMLARRPADLPPGRITAFNLFGVQYARRLRAAKTATGKTAAYLWAGQQLGRMVIGAGLGGATGVYGYNSAALEVFRFARCAGRATVLDQTIAPLRVEKQLLEQERAKYPEWEVAGAADELAETFMAREEAEWQEADVIVCGSAFVRDGVIRCGGAVDKCVIVPSGVDIPSPHRGEGGQRPDEMDAINLQPSTFNRSLRVLTVGAVGLRKGSPYVVEAASRLKGRAHIRMIGTIGVTSEVRARLASHVELLGPVPRSEVQKHYEWADVFLLPSLCEGSAMATYEALSCGLAVICTPNTGSAVRDGVDGFIVPPRDTDAIVDRIERLSGNRDLHEAMRRKAIERAAEFTLEAYGRRLLAALNRTRR